MKLFLAGLFILCAGLSCVSKSNRNTTPTPKVLRIGPDASLMEVFRVLYPTCKISFEVNSNRDKSSYRINLIDQCEANHPTRDLDYATILNAIFKIYPKATLEYLFSNSFYRLQLWDEKMALACLKSEKWIQFQANRNKIGTPNSVFVEIFNAADLGQQVRQAFLKEGLNIELSRVEKVMESKAAKLPFAAQHPELKNSMRRVAFSAGMYVFRYPQP